MDLNAYQRLRDKLLSYDEAIIRIRTRLESPRMSKISSPISVGGTSWKNDVMADGIADLFDLIEKREYLIAERDDLEQKIEHSIARLPPHDAEIFRLRYYRGYTFDKIGKGLNISGETVSRKYALLLKLLSNKLNIGEGYDDW